VRLKDIIELLAAAHIGASGHHIISQGEADKILNANMDERREMIEDALGLKIYHYKREESSRKLEKTEENLKQVSSLRREIAPHIKFLESQVKKIEKAREMRTDLENLYKEYLKRESAYIFHERGWIAAKRKGPEERGKRLEKELAEAKSILEKSSGKDAKSHELLKLEADLRDVRNEKDKLARELGRIEGQIASEERIIKKQKELAASDDARMVRFVEVEDLAKDVGAALDDAERADDIGLLKSIIKKVKTSIAAFIAKNRTASSHAGLADSEAEIDRLQAEKKKLGAKLEGLDDSEKKMTGSYAALQKKIEEEKDSNRDAEKAVFRIMAEQSEVVSELSVIRGREERLALVENDFKRELTDAGALIGRSVLDFEHFHIPAEGGHDRQVTDAEMAAESRDKQEGRRKTIERIKVRLEDAGGGSGDEVLKEYDEARNRDSFLAKETEDLEKSAATLGQLIADLGDKLDTEFKTGVDKINKQFQEFFALMFGGGTAGLHIVKQERRRRKNSTGLTGSAGKAGALGDDDEGLDEDDILGGGLEDETEEKEGIDITVNLPKKRIKGLMMLSGGERALTSIALLFAISQVNPPPFIVLDETDAALDEANSRKYGDMIANLSKYSQLILITHNRETMSRAGVLYGVTMGAEGFSKLLSIQFEEAVQVAK
jgi:chromosome segregation protein